MPTSIHQHLAADHARLDALLMTAISDPTHIDDAAYVQFRAGLLRHIAMEEKVLFVHVRTKNQTKFTELARILHADHAAIASLLVPPPTYPLIDTLQRILEEHNPLEEGGNGLYDYCDSATAVEVASMIDGMQAIAPVRVSQHLDEPRVHEHIERMLAARQKIPR